MLAVGLIFLYVLVSTYLIGFLALKGIERLCGQDVSIPPIKADGYVMAGLVVVTVYAQFFSLFYKVGFAANLLLVGVCILTAIGWRKQLAEMLKRQYGSLTRGRKIFYLLLFVFMAYGTSRGIIHYDTGLYHAQSIRWLEEYGVVKGLGNLHCRFAYNSSSFALSALYSFAFLGGQSYHCMAGFLALILAKVCSEIIGMRRANKVRLSDWVRLMGIYYLLIIYDEMISPASDYFMVLTVFYIIIRYLELVELGEKSWVLYGLLSLLCVYVTSIKLSAALIVLLVIKPAILMIREKRIREIFVFIGAGILIMAPYLIRNVVISGWMVYPFTVVDFFAVDWKIPKAIADYDAKEIQVWGRGMYDVADYGKPVSEWFGAWFGMQGAIDRLFVLAGIVAVPISLVAFVLAVWKRKSVLRDGMFVALVINASFLFWLLSAPLVRYGCVYLWLAATVTFGGLMTVLVKEGRWGKAFWKLVYVAIGLVGCYKAVALGKEIAAGYSAEYFVTQKDYENFEAQSYEVEGATFYYPVQGDRIGYDAFPSSPYEVKLELRGESVEDGFRYKE